MSEATDKIDIRRGLKGVYFDRSRVCFIDGRAGELRYRGYSIHDLAQHSTFEETCYLLLRGELPTRESLDRVRRGAQGRAHAARLDLRGDPSGRQCASDGRAAHRRLGARCVRSRRRDQFARGDAAQGHPPHVAGADDRRRARGDPQRARADRAGSDAFARRELPLHAARRDAERGRGAADGHSTCSCTPSTARTLRRSPRASWPGPPPTCTPRSPLRSRRSPGPRTAARRRT